MISSEDKVGVEVSVIGMALALAAARMAAVPAPISAATNPYQDDKAVLLRASRACHLHNGAAYFMQNSSSQAPVIHLTRAMGDTDLQIACVLQALPGDLFSRYRIDAPSPVRPTVQQEVSRGVDRSRPSAPGARGNLARQ